jgi:Flp pilus assembly protein TadG
MRTAWPGRGRCPPPRGGGVRVPPGGWLNGRQRGPGLLMRCGARAGGRRDRGSISVELVVLMPGLVLLLLLLAAGARVVEVQGHIDGAARDAARAASIARSSSEAVAFARQAALADLGTSSWCAQRSVAAQVRGFAAAGPAPANAGQVSVTVSCEVNMSPFSALGFAAHKRFTGQAVAPLDPFMCRNTAC